MPGSCWVLMLSVEHSEPSLSGCLTGEAENSVHGAACFRSPHPVSETWEHWICYQQRNPFFFLNPDGYQRCQPALGWVIPYLLRHLRQFHSEAPYSGDSHFLQVAIKPTITTSAQINTDKYFLLFCRAFVSLWWFFPLLCFLV